MKLTRLNELITGDGQMIKGVWELTPAHELRYRSEGGREEINLRASLVAPESNALVISVTEKQFDQEIVSGVLKLTGTWMLDPQNRIIFEVERESGLRDILTFDAGWKISGSNEIVYQYKETDLKTKKKEARELVFKGAWGISEQNRLTYFLSADSGASFRFRGAFQTKSILAKDGQIRYQAGVEIGGKRKIQTIALFGKWKVSRDFGLFFEIEYADGGKRTIFFGGEYSLKNDREIAVNLKSGQGEPLGVELILTQDIFGRDGEAFLRFQKSLEESRIEAGVSFKW